MPRAIPGAVLSHTPPRLAAAVTALIVAASTSITALASPTTVTAATVVAAPNTVVADRATDRADRISAGRADRARRAAATPAVQPLIEHATAAPVASPHRAVAHKATASRPTRVTTRSRTTKQVHAAAWVAPANGDRASTVISFALAQVGKPYVWDAAGPGSYDCSGLVLAAYARVGIRLPHQTGGIIDFGRHVTRIQLEPGDIVFPQAGHVAVYLGNNLIVHAPHSGDHVRVAPLYGFYSAVRLL